MILAKDDATHLWRLGRLQQKGVTNMTTRFEMLFSVIINYVSITHLYSWNTKQKTIT